MIEKALMWLPSMVERRNRVPPREDSTLFHIWQFPRITRTTNGPMPPTAVSGLQYEREPNTCGLLTKQPRSNHMRSRYLSCQADRPPWPRLASNTMAADGGAIGARGGQVRHDRRKVQCRMRHQREQFSTWFFVRGGGGEVGCRRSV